MTCKKCGLCCKLLQIPFNPKQKQQIKLAEMKVNYLKTIKHMGFVYVIFLSECKYLENNLCTINKTKPLICSTQGGNSGVYSNLWKKINPECGYFQNQ